MYWQNLYLWQIKWHSELSMYLLQTLYHSDIYQLALWIINVLAAKFVSQWHISTSVVKYQSTFANFISQWHISTSIVNYQCTCCKFYITVTYINQHCELSMYLLQILYHSDIYQPALWIINVLAANFISQWHISTSIVNYQCTCCKICITVYINQYSELSMYLLQNLYHSDSYQPA